MQLGGLRVKRDHQSKTSGIGIRHHDLLYRIQDAFIKEKEPNTVKRRDRRSGSEAEEP